MSIEDRISVVPGLTLVGKYKGAEVTCEVIVGAKGVEYLLDGKKFSGISAAASVAIGGGSVNGWKFWSIQGVERTPTERRQKAKIRSGLTPQVEYKPVVWEDKPFDAWTSSDFERRNKCFSCYEPMRANDGHYHQTAFPVRGICCSCAGCRVAVTT